jgi:hypothetical protein
VKLVVRAERKPQRYFICTPTVRHELRVCDIEFIMSAQTAEQQGHRLAAVVRESAFLAAIGYSEARS